MSRAGKVSFKLVATRLSHYCKREDIIFEAQNGCHPARSTSDMMFVARRRHELVRKKKSP